MERTAKAMLKGTKGRYVSCWASFESVWERSTVKYTKPKNMLPVPHTFKACSTEEATRGKHVAPVFFLFFTFLVFFKEEFFVISAASREEEEGQCYFIVDIAYLCDSGLRHINNVHDDPTLEHLGKTTLDSDGS